MYSSPTAMLLEYIILSNKTTKIEILIRRRYTYFLGLFLLSFFFVKALYIVKTKNKTIQLGFKLSGYIGSKKRFKKKNFVKFPIEKVFDFIIILLL
jgi:hypothetical protein|tara:strand:+ start:596 stop:883 length:288 start_codon:yes stop_codon:yes gene_type:complete